MVGGTPINVFLLCYNEYHLLPHTVRHYKKYLPSCTITIFDNMSSDGSVQLAKSLGCTVIVWKSGNILNEHKQTEIKNTCWKTVKSGWVIIADMDEFLCVNEQELEEEKKNGHSILSVKGLEMAGESATIDISDIDLQEITKYRDNDYESKSLCFLREDLSNINYCLGAHFCNPKGRNVKHSKKVYFNKHMSYLGLKFIINKYLLRYERTEKMRSMGISSHYVNNKEEITRQYNDLLSNCQILD